MKRSQMIIALVLAGCQQAPPAPDEKSPAIVNGTLDYGDPAVGWTGPGCSATLIGRRTVLTAAHCQAPNLRDQFCTCPDWHLAGCATCMWGSEVVYPYFDGKIDLSNYDDPEDDSLLLRLDGDFTSAFGVQPKRIGSAPYEGERIRLVGYGATVEGTGTGGGYKRTGYNVIADVSTNTFYHDDTSQSYDAGGDSGGPLFNGDSDCEVGSYAGLTAEYVWPFGNIDSDYTATRLDTKLWWIQPTSGDPTVLACGQTLCGDGFCVSPESCSTCPQDCGACDPNNPCAGQPDGTDCGDDCCTGFNKCRGGVCTTGTCCNTQACCRL